MSQSVNAAQCHACLAVLVSEHRHDFKFCACGDIAVDGGNDYHKRLFNDGADWTELTTQAEVDIARAEVTQ